MRMRKLLGYNKEMAKKNAYSLPCMIDESFAEQYLLHSGSPQMGQIFKTLGRLLDSNIPLLFSGETGVGKSVLAKVVHACGKQKISPFIKIDCKKSNEHIFTEKMFYPATTVDDESIQCGAKQNGSLAFCGTIFLQNVEFLPADLQLKILCMLKNKTVDCSSSGKKLALHVRIVAATRQDLWALVEKGQFRKDLFYRLSIYTLLLPPLRERSIDIGEFASHFSRMYAAQNNKKTPVFTKDAIAKLKRHTWPGNIRELREVVFKTVEAANEQKKIISNIIWPAKQNSRRRVGLLAQRGFVG